MGTEKRKQRNSWNTTIMIRLSLSNWSFLTPLTDEVNVCNYYSNNLFHYLIQSKKNPKTHFLDYLLKSSFYGFALKPNFSAPLCLSSSSYCISFCLKKKTSSLSWNLFSAKFAFNSYSLSSKCALIQRKNETVLFSVCLHRPEPLKMVWNMNCLI